MAALMNGESVNVKALIYTFGTGTFTLDGSEGSWRSNHNYHRVVRRNYVFDLSRPIWKQETTT